MKMAKGATWMVFLKLLERSIGIISTIILARLLLPEDFGINAMASSVIALIELMRAFNFDVVLIQRQTSERDYYDTAWSFNVCMGVISATILFLIAPFVADFYNEDRLVAVLHVLAIGTFITSLENIGMVDFRKNLEFHKEFSYVFFRKIAGFIVVLIVAYSYRSYWALILGTMAAHTAGLIISYIIHPYRPTLCFKAAKELFSFSSWLFVNNVLFFTKLRSADFVIGRILGGHALGIFSIAYEISNMPTTELIAPINRAVFPGYAKMKNIAELRQGFLDVVGLIFCFSLPVGMGLSVTAPIFIPILLGDKWYEIIPVVQLLAFFGVVTAMQTNLGHVLLAMGKPRILTLLAAVQISLLVPFLVFQTSSHGIIGAAWAYLIVALMTMPLNYMILMKNLELKLKTLLSVLWRPFFATLLMYFTVHKFVAYIEADSTNLGMGVGLGLSIALGTLVYSSTLLGLWLLAKKPSGAEKAVLASIRKIFRRSVDKQIRLRH